MARSIWKGSLAIGLINVPVALYKATDSANGTHKRWIHSTCHSPVNQVKVCHKCNKTDIQMSEILDGVLQEDGSFVILSKEEIAGLKAPTTDTILVEAFVPATSIDSIYVDSTYYLTPSKPTPGFALLRDAMISSEKVMTGRLSIYGREQLVMVRPMGKILVVQLLRTANEVRAIEGLPNIPMVSVDTKQLLLAMELVKLYAGDFNPALHKDTYAEAFQALVEAKKSGQVPAATTSPVIPTLDFMAAIMASLAAKQPKPAAKKTKKVRVA